LTAQQRCGSGDGNDRVREGAIQVDATIVAEGLGIEPSLVQGRMREGKITSQCERGIDEDNGPYRLTFFF
jgi:hypothetical protein